MPDDKRLNFYAACLLAEADLDRLDAEARRTQRSRSFVMRQAIRAHLERAESEAQSGAGP